MYSVVTSEPSHKAKNGFFRLFLTHFLLTTYIMIGSGVVRLSLSLSLSLFSFSFFLSFFFSFFLFSLLHSLFVRLFSLLSSPHSFLASLFWSLLSCVGSCGCCCSAGEETPDTDGKPVVELVNMATPTLESLMQEIARLRRDNNLK
jgi:hypothetical protein